MDALLIRRMMMEAGGTPPPVPVNLAGSVDSWLYHKGSSSSIAQWDTRGYGVLGCYSNTDVNNYAVYAVDRSTTLWSSVVGNTILVRVKTNSITDGLFQLGVYQNAQITSMSNSNCKRAGLPNLTLANDGYYEQTFVCDIANFTVGSLTPGANATFGLNCFSRSKTVYEQIFDAQIYKVI